MKTPQYVVRVLILQTGKVTSSCLLTRPGSRWSGRVLGVYLYPKPWSHYPVEREWNSSTPSAVARQAYKHLRQVKAIGLSGEVPLTYCNEPVIAPAP